MINNKNRSGESVTNGCKGIISINDVSMKCGRTREVRIKSVGKHRCMCKTNTTHTHKIIKATTCRVQQRFSNVMKNLNTVHKCLNKLRLCVVVVMWPRADAGWWSIQHSQKVNTWKCFSQHWWSTISKVTNTFWIKCTTYCFFFICKRNKTTCIPWTNLSAIGYFLNSMSPGVHIQHKDTPFNSTGFLYFYYLTFPVLK